MRALAFAGVAILALIAAAIAFAPAALVDSRVNAMTSGQVRLAATEGTVWRGRGTVVMGDGVPPVPLTWQLDPWSLLRGEALITLDSPADGVGPPRGRVTLSAGRAHVVRLEFTVPAAALSARLPVPGLQAGGTVEVTAEDLAIAGTVERGSLRLAWRGARLTAEGQPTVDLGTVTAELAARQGALAGPLTARGGTIRIDGETSLAPGGVRLAARLVPEPTASAVDRALLAKLGAPAADGSVSIDVTRSLRR
jgi:Type II secretion system (T2SS), protein N